MKNLDELHSELTESINDFFGCDAMYYDVDSYALAGKLIMEGWVKTYNNGPAETFEETTEAEKLDVIEYYEKELSQCIYNSETLDNAGLRTIYGNKANRLSQLLHMAKKQIPKKVEVTKYDIGGNDYFCHCGNKLQNGAEYCDMCGCKLDWSDTE